MFKQIFLIFYTVMLVVGVLITLDNRDINIAVEQYEYEAEQRSTELTSEIEALYIELEKLGEMGE